MPTTVHSVMFIICLIQFNASEFCYIGIAKLLQIHYFGHKITKKCRKNVELYEISANNLIFLCNFAANITQMSNKVIQNG